MDNIRVPQICQRLSFGQKFAFIIRHNPGIQHFECSVALEVAMLAKINPGTTALPQQLNDLIVAEVLSQTICHSVFPLELVPTLEQGLCIWSKARWDLKIQCISEPINDIEEGTHINGLKHGLLTDPCCFQCCHIAGLDFLGMQSQLLQV